MKKSTFEKLAITISLAVWLTVAFMLLEACSKTVEPVKPKKQRIYPVYGKPVMEVVKSGNY